MLRLGIKIFMPRTINGCHWSLPVSIISSQFSDIYWSRNWCTWYFKNSVDGLNLLDKKVLMVIVMKLYLPENKIANHILSQITQQIMDLQVLLGNWFAISNVSK